MQTELKLPPSGRDFQVYQRVIVDAASTRQVASEFSLSQTRVRQVVQRVSQWLITELPAASKEQAQVQLWLARNVAADRLQSLYGEMMARWRKLHDTKNFGMALRVITAQSKLPALPGLLEGLTTDASEELLDSGIEIRTSQVDDQPPPTSNSLPSSGPATFDVETLTPAAPPAGDCSPAAETGPVVSAPPSQSPAAMPDTTMTSDEQANEVRTARRAFFGPAQQPVAQAADRPLAEQRISPPLKIDGRRKLTRRERRRLAKIGA